MIDLRKIILILSVALVPVLSYAQNTKKQESRKAAIQREIEIINRQLKENSRNSAKALSSLTLVRKKISSRKALIDESESEIRTLNDSILIRQKEIDQLQDRLDTLNHYYGKLVQNAYRNRDSRIWYMYILSSANLSQAFRRTGYLRGLSSAMNRQAEDIKEIRSKTGLTQSLFAQWFGVSTRTVEAWESGRNKPSGPSSRWAMTVKCLRRPPQRRPLLLRPLPENRQVRQLIRSLILALPPIKAVCHGLWKAQS